MEDLKNTIKEIQSYRKFNFNPSDDHILECATRIFISNNISESKEYKESKKEPATKKQIHYLKSKKIPFNEDITKQEAYQLIKEDKK